MKTNIKKKIENCQIYVLFQIPNQQKYKQIMSANQYNIFSQMEHLHSKYPGCGHPDTTRWEWLTNQHRDTYASIMGRPDMVNLIAITENECKARVRFNLMQKMFQPCGPPPKKASWLL